MSERVLETKNLTKKYGDFTALDDLSIHVDRGQILGFIGPNGAGKTTTIKILVGLSKPTSGSASIAGVDCSENASRTRIAEVMEITNTAYMQDKYVESLSHGMQQRVGIARTLLHDPEVLILDEPANGLDPKARIEMRQLLLQLAAQGKTLIVTSHILPELARICNVVAIVTHGKLRAFGSVDEVMSKLCPQRNYEVQLATSEAMEQGEKTLRGMLTDTEPISASPAELTLRFPTVRSEAELSEVLYRLVGAKVPVVQFREVTSDLEDAFLSVAGKD